ncbi:MAG TPA: glycosyltransferase family 4 protein [Polyangiaceae bacterium]|nr:glycosyltransferase family 4 protein [Polyangiaceae bacterium]
MTSTPRVLILLPQLPHDPASGAARTLSTIGELLAANGFECESIATTASGGHARMDLARWLAGMDVPIYREPADTGGLIRFVRRGVGHTLVDTGGRTVNGWESDRGGQYDQLVDEALARQKPDLLLTYGGSQAEMARQRRARDSGARVVFALYNACYGSRSFFEHADDVITPSEFLSQFYLRAFGLRTTPLPTPLWQEDVIAIDREPAYLTMINPEPEKGLMFFAALVELLARKQPQIPIEVFASRGGATFLVQTALIGGIDLALHSRLELRDTEVSPTSVYQRSRVVVVPSLVDDAAPRVVVEAQVNGIPVLGSDRGGIPEMCTDAGLVIPIPRAVLPGSLRSPPPEAVRPWVEAITRLFDDPAAWARASARARAAGARYLAAAVSEQYANHFRQVLDKPRVGQAGS